MVEKSEVILYYVLRWRGREISQNILKYCVCVYVCVCIYIYISPAGGTSHQLDLVPSLSWNASKKQSCNNLLKK